MKKVRVGRVSIDEKYFLKILCLSGGKILHIGLHENYLGISVVVEHPSMPEVSEGEQIPEALVAYHKFVEPQYNDSFITRILPPLQLWYKILEVLRYIKWIFGRGYK